MGNSGLIDCVVKSPNHSGQRLYDVTRITPHCVVGQLSAEAIGSCFVNSSSQASCNYGIGKDGRVCLVVDEVNRSWCSSSRDNDNRAITIEVASDATSPYAFTDRAYSKLIDLCVDICKRYGKKRLLWIADRDKSLSYEPKQDEMVLTVHRWFATFKECPGDWMMTRMGDLAVKVTAKLNGQGMYTNYIENTSSKPYKVNIDISNLKIRKGPGTNYDMVGYTGKGYFTIVDTANGQGSYSGWGLLKSYAGNRDGWVSLDYAKKV